MCSATSLPATCWSSCALEQMGLTEGFPPASAEVFRLDFFQ